MIMNIDKKWRSLGYNHIAWELLRYYLSVRGEKNQKDWLKELRNNNSLATDESHLPLPADGVQFFFEYLELREQVFDQLFTRLRDEEAAKKYCRDNAIEFGTTATQNADHHQASKALVATVSTIAVQECSKRGIQVDPNPHKRCVWCNENGLHVTARNLDGAIPSTVNPYIVWEIKEYWGKTSGGSKMSDAVYECNLVGRELRDFEQRTGASVIHAVFVDGKDQWTARKSDLRRIIDLTYQGLIDLLFVGSDVEASWRGCLSKILDRA
jgi:hypothetical protein